MLPVDGAAEFLLGLSFTAVTGAAITNCPIMAEIRIQRRIGVDLRFTDENTLRFSSTLQAYLQLRECDGGLSAVTACVYGELTRGRSYVLYLHSKRARQKKLKRKILHTSGKLANLSGRDPPFLSVKILASDKSLTSLGLFRTVWVGASTTLPYLRHIQDRFRDPPPRIVYWWGIAANSAYANCFLYDDATFGKGNFANSYIKFTASAPKISY